MWESSCGSCVVFGRPCSSTPTDELAFASKAYSTSQVATHVEGETTVRGLLADRTWPLLEAASGRRDEECLAASAGLHGAEHMRGLPAQWKSSEVVPYVVQVAVSSGCSGI